MRTCHLLNKDSLVKFFFATCKEYGFEKVELAPEITGIYFENKANESDRRKNEMSTARQ